MSGSQSTWAIERNVCLVHTPTLRFTLLWKREDVSSPAPVLSEGWELLGSICCGCVCVKIQEHNTHSTHNWCHAHNDNHNVIAQSSTFNMRMELADLSTVLKHDGVLHLRAQHVKAACQSTFQQAGGHRPHLLTDCSGVSGGVH